MSIARTSCVLVVAFFMALLPAAALGHCDALDGPVVTAARHALATGNVSHALAWVQKDDEPEIRVAFQRAINVRKLNADAKELADRYFFETIVRVHRAGEGEPYTGLKPSGQPVRPAAEAVDKSVDGGSAEPILMLLWDAMRVGVERRFAEATAARASDDDVEAMRRQVRAYVTLLHYVERIYEVAASRQSASDVSGHDPEHAK